MMDSSNALSSSPLTQTEQAELDTLLLKAAQDGDTDTVSALIAAGANVDAADQYGNTALMAAAFHGRTNTVSVLIAARAEPKRS
jgi:ankyrin repeat protein